MIIGPGLTPWMKSAAMQDRGRRRTGHGESERRYQRAGHDGVVAGFGGGQAVDRAFSEFLRRLARSARCGIGGPRADIFTDARNDADEGPDHA